MNAETKSTAFLLVICLTLFSCAQHSSFGFAERPVTTTKSFTVKPEKVSKIGERIKEVIYHENLLWLLTGNGELFSLEINQKSLNRHNTEGEIADMFIDSKKHLHFLVTKKEGVKSKAFIITKDKTGWREIHSIELRPEELAVGLFEFGNQIVVLTNKRINLLENANSWKITKLSKDASRSLQSNLAATSNGFIYSGMSHLLLKL